MKKFRTIKRRETKAPPPPKTLACLGLDGPDPPNPELQLPKIEVVFADAFAPSVAELHSTDDQLSRDQTVRHLFYNEQVVQTFTMATDRAHELGFPRLYNFFPIIFPKLNDGFPQQYADALHRIVPTLEEGTCDWLCVQCYVRWVEACREYHEGASPDVFAESLFFAGAAARELELSVLNRLDALRGKKTIQAAKTGGANRKINLAHETRERLDEMERLITAGHSINAAANILARNDQGTQTANRALWYRHQKKKL